MKKVLMFAIALCALAGSLRAQSINYPTTLDTDTSLLVFADNRSMTLMTAITSGSSSATVDSTSGVPTACVALIGNELVRVTVTSGTTLSLTQRGAGNTLAAAHIAKSPVRVVFTSHYINTLRLGVEALEAKVGAGSGASTLGAVFMGTGAGSSGWTTTPTFTGLATFNAGLTSPGAGTSSERFGASAVAAGSKATAIGNGASAGHSNGIALGSGATTTGSFQLVVGSASAPVVTGYFGSGATASFPTAFTFEGTGGSGSNIGGADIALSAGRSTGSANGGQLYFKTTPAGSSGSSLNAALERMRITSAGLVGVNQTGTITARFEVVGDALLTSDAAGTIPLKVKGAASQTGDLSQWLNSSGTVLAKVDKDGDFITTGYLGFDTFRQQDSGVVRAISASTYTIYASSYQLSWTDASDAQCCGTNDIGLRRDSAGVLAVTGDLGGTTLGGIKVGARTASNIPMQVKGAASQTGDLTEWLNSSGTVLAKVDKDGRSTFDWTTAKHFIGAGSTPSVSLNAACGTGASVVVTGTDAAGRVRITTGTSATSGCIVTITFATAYGSAPFPSWGANNDMMSAFPDFFLSSSSTTLTGTFNTAVSDAENYNFFYQAVQ
jgi:hypothetical protein